jgi:hypothetical protein
LGLIGLEVRSKNYESKNEKVEKTKLDVAHVLGQLN